MWQRNIRCRFQPYQSWTRLSAFFVGMAIVGFLGLFLTVGLSLYN